MAIAITVAIPFFNSEQTLGDSIRSVFAQTHRDWELLLVDDGSTDGSLELAMSVRDSRVRVVTDGRNLGLPTRLNEIARLAGTDALARMDGDDLMHPERLARQLAYLEEWPRVDVVGSAVVAMDVAGEPFGIRGDWPLDSSPSAVVGRGLFAHPTVMGRRSWFLRNPYDPAFVRAEDTELWCRTCTSSTFGSIPEPLLFYREGLASSQSYAKGVRSVRRVLRTYGPQAVGSVRAEAMALLTHAKSAVYAAASAVGARQWLVSRRSRPLTAAAREEARRTLRAIRSTKVPGLVSDRERSTPRREHAARRAVPA